MKSKKNVLGIVLYVFTAIFAIVALYSMVSAIQYVHQMAASGAIVVSESFGDILMYIIGSAGAYVFYALVLGTLGKMMQSTGSKNTGAEAVAVEKLVGKTETLETTKEDQKEDKEEVVEVTEIEEVEEVEEVEEDKNNQ